VLSGCAVTVAERMSSTPHVSPADDAAGNHLATTVAAAIVPPRGGGMTTGAEVELGECARLHPDCPGRVAVRNGSLSFGYALVPNERIPGFDLTLVTSAGGPVGPRGEEGTRFRFAPDATFVLPITAPDVRRGYVVLGLGLEAVLSARVGVWSPPIGTGPGPALGEYGVGLGVRVRAFTDAMVREGYPAPTRYDR
jgi:hypothetical protein